MPPRVVLLSGVHGFRKYQQVLPGHPLCAFQVLRTPSSRPRLWGPGLYPCSAIGLQSAWGHNVFLPES